MALGLIILGMIFVWIGGVMVGYGICQIVNKRNK